MPIQCALRKGEASEQEQRPSSHAIWVLISHNFPRNETNWHQVSLWHRRAIFSFGKCAQRERKASEEQGAFFQPPQLNSTQVNSTNKGGRQSCRRVQFDSEKLFLPQVTMPWSKEKYQEKGSKIPAASAEHCWANQSQEIEAGKKISYGALFDSEEPLCFQHSVSLGKEKQKGKGRGLPATSACLKPASQYKGTEANRLTHNGFRLFSEEPLSSQVFTPTQKEEYK